jgi:hypothetical protein
MHASEHARTGAAAQESKAAPDSEQSSVRRRQSAQALTAVALTSVGANAAAVHAALHGTAPSRGVNLANKIATARALQSRVSEESREGQLLAIAILRRDESLLDELIRRVSRR